MLYKYMYPALKRYIKLQLTTNIHYQNNTFNGFKYNK